MKVAFCFLLFLSVVLSLACNFQWECAVVSESYNYVDCVDHACACNEKQGFSGAATPADKCRCDATKGGEVFWKAGKPYCLNVVDSARSYTRRDKLLNIVKLIFEVYTQQSISLDIIEGRLSVDDIIRDDSNIRVDILGSFGGVTEYLFALWAQNSIQRSVVRDYMVDAQLGQVYAQVDFTFDFFGFTLNATYDGAIKFADDDRVVAIDFNAIWFERLDLFTQNPVAKELIIADLCNYYTVHCIPFGFTGYSNFEACQAYHATANYGAFALIEDDSTLCHYFHRQLTPYKKVHCSHMEPNGGNDDPLKAACSRKPPNFYYAKDV